MQKLTKYFGIWDVATLLVCAVFVLIKLPFLHLPYFWDEAWVYAPAVFDMYENGPSLSPDSINPELSRGHPILFHFLAVCWMTIFGTSTTVLHAFSVLCGLLLIWAVYLLGTQLASKKLGFWTAFLFATQPIFVSQAGFLLPEVLLAVFVVLTILTYLQRKTLLFILFGTAMLLTKETGILVIGVIGIVELFHFISNRNFSKKRVVELLAIGAPLVFTAIYFLIQHSQFGWYMFPEHMSMFDTNPETWARKRSLIYQTVFQNQQRFVFIGLAMATVSLAWQNGPKALRILCGLIGLTFITMTDLSSWLPNWYYYWVFPIIIVGATIWTTTFFVRNNSKNELFLPIAGLLAMVMIYFTSAHFVIGRYMLFVIPLVITSSIILIHLALKRSQGFFNVLMICLGLVFYHHLNKADARLSSIDNMAYVNRIEILHESIGFLEQNVDLDQCISGTFIFQQALQNPIQGYRKTEKLPSCIDNKVLPNINYVLTLSFDNDHGTLKAVENDPEFEKIWESQKGTDSGRIYKRL